MIMLTGSLREEFVDFSLCEFHGTNGVRVKRKKKKEKIERGSLAGEFG
jgi:hypothetical protein